MAESRPMIEFVFAPANALRPYDVYGLRWAARGDFYGLVTEEKSLPVAQEKLFKMAYETMVCLNRPNSLHAKFIRLVRRWKKN